MDNRLTSVERDTISRNKIVSETDANFFVEAGAGSGKTTMLVNRMVAMVEQGKDISKISAITFTKAAAGEFYDRFQKLLIERSNPDYIWEDKGFAGQLARPTEETRQRCAKALENIDLCFMGTIDSFCGMILSEHPFDAKIPSDAKIMSDDEATVVYRQQFVKICSGEYGPELAKSAKAFRSFYYNAEEVFIQAENVLMNNRNVHFNYDAPREVDIDREFASERDEIIAAMKCLDEHREVAFLSENKNLAAWEKVSSARRAFRTKWSSNLYGVMKALENMAPIRVIPEALDTFNVSLGNCFEETGSFTKWLEFTPSRMDGIYGRLMEIKYDITMSFLSSCIPILEEAMRDKGYMTFFDYLYYLRNMLREDAKGDGALIRYIYDRHSYFLIDEFQDTNPLQAEVFFYLSAENPVEDWSKCIPKPGALFIVGDPKQSIYRFRSADVTSFLNVKKLFGENGILYLSKNFRSTQMLCSYFNRVFSLLLPVETEIQSKFEEIPLPAETTGEFQGIYTYKAYTGKALLNHPDEDDPSQIVKIVERIVGRDDLLITTNDDKTPRPIQYGDIMVITPSKTGIGGIMASLNREDIPIKVEGKVPFDSNEALILLSDYYAVVADAADDHALYRVLKNRINGFNDDEILRFRQDGGRLSVIAENILRDEALESSTRILDAMKRLQEMYYRALKLSPAAVLTEIMDAIEIYEYASVDNLEVVYYTLELFRSAEKSGTLVTARDGAEYLNIIIRNASGQDRCLSLTESDDCVHIANLHKVKGLEAPIVILAAASTWKRPVDKRVVHKNTGTEGYIFSLTKIGEGFNNPVFFKTDEYNDEKIKEEKAYEAEEKRLIYVAATRARNSLIIANRIAGKSISSKWSPIVEAGTRDFFDTVPDCPVGSRIVRKSHGEPLMVSDLYERAKDESIFKDRNCEESTYHVMNPSHVRIASKIAEDSALSEETDDGNAENELNSSDSTVAAKSDVHRFPALLGTMTHKLMEMIVSTRKALNVSDAINEIIREYSTPQSAAYIDKLAEALKTVADTMYAGGYAQTNDAPEDILSVLLDADECFCEIPFCYKETVEGVDTIWNGIMDVIYKSDGKWHIIDYKTNADGTELDEKYNAQLQAYIKAFKEITGEEVLDAKTYHIDV